jgi:hypothetical protein
VSITLCLKTVSFSLKIYNAGIRAPVFISTGGSITSILTTCPIEYLEGSLSVAWDTDYSTPLTDLAKDFVAAYSAKYGEDSVSEILGWTGCFYSCLKEALQKADSLDPDKVCAVVFNGLKFDSIGASYEMISRPDVGNNRTVDSVLSFSIKQIKNGEQIVFTTVSLDDALSSFRTVHPAK